MLVVILAVWLIANFLTAARYPCASNDEVAYADPAVNLLLHGKWVSTGWYAQDISGFFAGNVPLYPALLFLWLKVFGFSIVTVRSLDYVLFAMVAIILYAAIPRLTAASRGSSAAGIVFTLLLLFGYSLIFDYRSARPDVLTILLVSIPALACIARWRFRIAVVSLCAFLLPCAGLQTLPLLVVLALFLLWLNWREYWQPVFAAGFGSACGVAALLALYHSHGVLGAFFRSIRWHVAQTVTVHRYQYPKDFSLVILLAGAIGVELIHASRGRFRLRSPLALGILLSLAISASLVLAGKFETYYGWMAYIPLSIAAVIEWAKPGLDRLSGRLLECAFAAAIFIGAGLHICSAVYNWPYRDPSLPDQLVARNLKPGDIAYADPSAYYGLLNNGFTPYVGYYADIMSQQEKNLTSVLVVQPRFLSEATAKIGGAWKLVDAYIPPRTGFLGTRWNMGFLSEFDYTLGVYRRTGASSSSSSR